MRACYKHVIEYVSSADYDGAGMISASDVYCHSLADVRRALASRGYGIRLSTVRDRAIRHSLLIDALYSYGFADPANHYPDYHAHEWDSEPAEADVIEYANSYAR